MGDRGFIKDYRQELDSDIWIMPPLYHRVWQYLKYKVNHTDNEIPMRDGTKLLVKKGQHLTSYRKIAKGIGWYEGPLWKEPNSKTVKTICDWLEANEMISQNHGTGNRQYTLITIVNWDLYQSKESEVVTDKKQLGNSQVTVRKQLVDINKNDKNDKNDKKKDIKAFCPNSDEFRLASYLFSWIKQNNPKAKKPNLQLWSKTFNLMIRIDERPVNEIKQVIEWCQKDAFWYKNILSADKLRKQYDRLLLQMQSKKEIPDNKQGRQFKAPVTTFNSYDQRHYDIKKLEKALLGRGDEDG